MTGHLRRLAGAAARVLLALADDDPGRQDQLGRRPDVAELLADLDATADVVRATAARHRAAWRFADGLMEDPAFELARRSALDGLVRAAENAAEARAGHRRVAAVLDAAVFTDDDRGRV